MPPTSTQIRQQFIDFFSQRASHTYVPSSPVVPHDDPTLLFTNAGMNQFKPLFLGQADPHGPLASLTRAVNSQKCIRAGGKHNDLDDVGKDTYHHTFFEMLGNWSFGDYFKREAIQWAWELLTNVWGLDPERLYATYFEGNKSLAIDADREAYDLWLNYLPPGRILPGNMKDNFWEMGDTGPCGPCSEIHYDARPESMRKKVPGYELVNRESPDVIEIWNLVFIQFNRTGPTELEPLPAKHVDTGMGFERITRFLQGKDSNYDTDVFTPLFNVIQKATGARAYQGGPDSLHDPIDTAYRVVADHIRTLSFAIVDGAEPSNDGRGYVLRRILRRAVRFGRQTLGAEGPFLGQLVPTLVEQMGDVYPELRKNPDHIIAILTDEEEAFGRTLDHGIKLFDDAAKGRQRISAEDAFKLHDTYGFPIDLTELMARERGLTVDSVGFVKLMEEARERSRMGTEEGVHNELLLNTKAVDSLHHMTVKPTIDAPKYDDKKLIARIDAIWNGSDFDENIKAANTRPTDRFAIIFDKTNHYAEQGGQVADTGRAQVVSEARSAARAAGAGAAEFIIEDVRNSAGYVVHIGRIAKGELRVGDRVELRVDRPRRKAIASNHTATHLLNLALRNTLGAHVDQKGSFVAPDRLRFDFSHNAPFADDEVARIVKAVRDNVAKNLTVYATTAALPDARKINTLRAVFGETYPDPVRVVSIGAPVADLLADPTNDIFMNTSVEFCGGTHLESTGPIESFALIAEESVSKGVRRVVALTGDLAAEAIANARGIAKRIDGATSLPDAHLATELAAISDEVDHTEIPLEAKAALRKALATLHDRAKSAAKQAARAGRDHAVDVAKQIAASASGPVIVEQVPAGADRQALMAAMDTVRAKHEGSAIMLLSADETEGKVAIVAQVPKALIGQGLKAGDWVRVASEACGGKGGGRPDSAQGGGTDPTKLPAAIEAARAFVSQHAG